MPLCVYLCPLPMCACLCPLPLSAAPVRCLCPLPLSAASVRCLCPLPLSAPFYKPAFARRRPRGTDDGSMLEAEDTGDDEADDDRVHSETADDEEAGDDDIGEWVSESEYECVFRCPNNLCPLHLSVAAFLCLYPLPMPDAFVRLPLSVASVRCLCASGSLRFLPVSAVFVSCFCPLLLSAGLRTLQLSAWLHLLRIVMRPAPNATAARAPFWSQASPRSARRWCR